MAEVGIQFGDGFTVIDGEKLRHTPKYRVFTERGKLLKWQIALVNPKHETVALVTVFDGNPRHATITRVRGCIGRLTAEAQRALAVAIAKKRFEKK